MEAKFYRTLHDIQERHWWYSARRTILDSVMRDLRTQGLPEGTIYDLGCGVGANLPVLARYGHVVGVDTSTDAVEYCHSRGFSDVRLADLNSLEGLPDASASVVLLADVIEHLDDEAACLSSVHRLLKPGGVLIVTVPAFMFLWGPSDEISHHRRRYVEPEVKALLSRWFDVERTTYFNTLLFGTVVVGRTLERLLGRGGDETAHVPPGLVNGALRSIFAAEAPLLRRMRLPFGVSILCVARKTAV